MRPPVNSYSAPKNEKDQGKHNAWLVDQVTALERRVADLETQLEKTLKRQGNELSNATMFNDLKVDFGPGVSKVMFLGNSTSPPTVDPEGGVFLYVSEGRLMAIGSGGTITELTPA